MWLFGLHFLVLIAVSLGGMGLTLFFVHSRVSLKRLLVAFLTANSVVLFLASAFTWALRDGIGLGWVPTTGREAWRVFWPCEKPILVFHASVIAFGLLGTCVSRWRLRREGHRPQLLTHDETSSQK